MNTTKKHFNVVAAVVVENGRVLCMQRCRTQYDYTSEKWEFPGGKIEPGETEPQALKRELKEEMDYRVEVEEHLATIEHNYPDFSITLSAWRCRPLQQHFKMLEHLDYQWLTPLELPKLCWAAADKKVVAVILNNEVK